MVALHAKGSPVNPTIIVIGGISGAGKSTLAKELSKLLNIPSFSKDELEAAVSRKGLCNNKDTKNVGYELLSVLAQNQIDNNGSVIIDFIASKQRVMALWPKLLTNDIKYIECICSNVDIHKQRIESRNRGITGWYELTWSDVLKTKKVFQPLQENRLVLDSTNSLNDNIDKAIKYVSQQCM